MNLSKKILVASASTVGAVGVGCAIVLPITLNNDDDKTTEAPISIASNFIESETELVSESGEIDISTFQYTPPGTSEIVTVDAIDKEFDDVVDVIATSIESSMPGNVTTTVDLEPANFSWNSFSGSVPLDEEASPDEEVTVYGYTVSVEDMSIETTDDDDAGAVIQTAEDIEYHETHAYVISDGECTITYDYVDDSDADAETIVEDTYMVELEYETHNAIVTDVSSDSSIEDTVTTDAETTLDSTVFSIDDSITDSDNTDGVIEESVETDLYSDDYYSFTYNDPFSYEFGYYDPYMGSFGTDYMFDYSFTSSSFDFYI